MLSCHIARRIVFTFLASYEQHECTIGVKHTRIMYSHLNTLFPSLRSSYNMFWHHVAEWLHQCNDTIEAKSVALGFIPHPAFYGVTALLKGAPACLSHARRALSGIRNS